MRYIKGRKNRKELLISLITDPLSGFDVASIVSIVFDIVCQM